MGSVALSHGLLLGSRRVTGRTPRSLYLEIRERGYVNSEETRAHFTAQLRRDEVQNKLPSSVRRALARGIVPSQACLPPPSTSPRGSCAAKVS